MNRGQYNWEKLWELFERLILEPKSEHLKIIEAEGLENTEMQMELQELLDAHYSESVLLDVQPHWQS